MQRWRRPIRQLLQSGEGRVPADRGMALTNAPLVIVVSISELHRCYRESRSCDIPMACVAKVSHRRTYKAAFRDQDQKDLQETFRPGSKSADVWTVLYCQRESPECLRVSRLWRQPTQCSRSLQMPGWRMQTLPRFRFFCLDTLPAVGWRSGQMCIRARHTCFR